MSNLWVTAIWTEGASKPVPTKAENITRTMSDRQSMGYRHFHEMTADEFAQQPGVYWHGSPNGQAGLKQAHYGVHVGTRQAAKEALNATIGTPGKGDWDGTREYGKTMLVPGTKTGYGAGWHRKGWDDDTSRVPDGSATYSGGSAIPLNVKPSIFPLKIVGEMTNSSGTPHEDFKANGMMAGQIKRGTARRGYYYENVAEDPGSVSAVVPNADHLATHEDFVRHVHEHGDWGKPIHPDNIERYGLS